MQVPCPLPWMKGCLALSSSGVFLLCPGMNKESCVGFFFFFREVSGFCDVTQLNWAGTKLNSWITPNNQPIALFTRREKLGTSFN
jgi:hypothetical protein